jgi:hypothetical protein
MLYFTVGAQFLLFFFSGGKLQNAVFYGGCTVFPGKGLGPGFSLYKRAFGPPPMGDVSGVGGFFCCVFACFRLLTPKTLSKIKIFHM